MYQIFLYNENNIGEIYKNEFYLLFLTLKETKKISNYCLLVQFF